jgi:hypothetical protein
MHHRLGFRLGYTRAWILRRTDVVARSVRDARHWAKRGDGTFAVTPRRSIEPGRRTRARDDTSPVARPMRILLTGGAGFIGSHVAERLASRHAEYTVRAPCGDVDSRARAWSVRGAVRGSRARND